MSSTCIFQASLRGNVCLHGLKKYVVLFSERLKKYLAEQFNREKKKKRFEEQKVPKKTWYSSELKLAEGKQ